MRGIRGLGREERRGELGSAIVEEFQRNKESKYRGRRQQRGEVGWRHVGLGEMGLSDEGERKKKRRNKEERREAGERERERKDKIFFFTKRRERV